MEFNRLLNQFDDEATQQEQVGLIFYYFEQFEQQDEVTQTDVKTTIQETRSQRLLHQAFQHILLVLRMIHGLHQQRIMVTD